MTYKDDLQVTHKLFAVRLGIVITVSIIPTVDPPIALFAAAALLDAAAEDSAMKACKKLAVA